MSPVSKRIRSILVVDDDRATQRILERMLRDNGYDVHTANDGLEAVEILKERSFHLVLTDWSMPEMDGEALCRWIRDRDEDEYTYLMILTSNDDRAYLKRGFDAGADDYVTKPFDREELLARLRVGRRILSLQESMLATERNLREIADRDGLTNLLNRRAVDARLLEAFSYFRRRSRPLSIALLDLDHFKHVNDAFGHPAGDAVLVEAARRIDDTVRQYDTLGRYGGEEFLLLFPDTVAWSARLVAERVRQALEAQPVHHRGRNIQITASLGIATVEIGFDGEVRQLLEAADGALYEAKRRGRNRVVSVNMGIEGEINHPAPTLDLIRA